MYSPLAIATPVLFPFGKPVILVFNEFYIWKTLFHHYNYHLANCYRRRLFLLQCVLMRFAHLKQIVLKVADVIAENDNR
jgi:hypothetical protein